MRSIKSSHSLGAFTLACATVGALCSQSSAQPEPPLKPPSSATTAPSSPAVPLITADEVATRMLKSIAASAYLHVNVTTTLDSGTYEIEAWMSASSSRTEVTKSGRLVFAHFVGGGRVQEYAPAAGFKHGRQATDVLLEYDAGPNNTSDDWPRLVDHDFACGTLGETGDSWLRDGSESIPSMVAENIRSSTVSEAEVDGRPCYRCLSVRRMNDKQTVVWDMYFDKVTCEPVRRNYTNQNGVKIVTTKTDFHIEHLPVDNGMVRRLDAASLRGKATPEVKPQVEVRP